MSCHVDGKWYWRHKWGKWVSVREPIVRTDTGSRIGSYIEQSRKCERCDKTQTETQEHRL